MDTWFILTVFICGIAIIKYFFCTKDDKKLPPGPSLVSSHFLLLTKSILELEPILKNLMSKYGPLITFKIGTHPVILVGSHSVTHQVLIQKGAIFSDRPKIFRFYSISQASYGPTWRILRRNLASEFLHPSQLKSYSWAHKWVLDILIGRLRAQQEAAGSTKVVEHFEFAMFHLLVLMCFGEKLDDHCVNDIVSVQLRLMSLVDSCFFIVYNLHPKLGKILFKNTWKDYTKLRHDQKQLFIPLINSRIDVANSAARTEVIENQIVTYVDTLLKLKLPKEEITVTNENGGKLTQKEMVNLCGEFLNVGTSTTTIALQWIMANLVKYPHIQDKLFDEITSIVGTPPSPRVPGVEPRSAINENDLQKMTYLKAVVLEGLRRHPPGHYVLPHRVMKEVEVQGYVIPEGATINFMTGEMGLDPKVWDDPLEFKPERFLVNEGVFDISGSKGIKMMPFGVGRRICPGSDLALLHLEYFVANLIWYFRWSVSDGCHVDLSEKPGFIVVMKNPLQAKITSRAHTTSLGVI